MRSTRLAQSTSSFPSPPAATPTSRRAISRSTRRAISTARANGQSIVVLNQPGASGAIGTQAVRNAPADGYTLLLARIASQVILPATDRKAPYQWNDFTLLSVLEINPYVCAVKDNSPYASMKDLIDAIRRQPGELNFATVGAGTIQNFGPRTSSPLSACPGPVRAGCRARSSRAGARR